MLLEYKKLFNNKNFYLSICALVLLVVIAVWIGVKEHKEEYLLTDRIYSQYYEKDIVEDVLIFVSPHKQWLGFTNNFASQLYYLIFPLLISIALVDSIYRERKSGYQHFIFMRMHRRKYYTAKFGTTFLTAFFLFLLPLCLGVVLVNIFTNQWDYTAYANIYKGFVEGTLAIPDNAISVFKGDIRSLFSDLLSMSPYIYTIVFYIIGGLFASAYVCMGLALSMFIKNYYLLVFMPQIIYTSIWFLTAYTPALAPFHFISPIPGVKGVSMTIMVTEFVLQIFITFVIYLIGMKKHEDVL
ncbi:NADH dehydrogenase FAD-containing subunit [Lysinibacillus mangiferihumi]|uniref:NADH dehydrogenase FAD-containing subunit n=1 Tax=Lysinibacillus mangiferihumi TaxID=1130819 RepID=A0A4U2Z3N7_9BACI|nr:NADH dehydrogenase FAD-containing subunit [Lysinibacillus mangiferihumi]TKI68806.1 NADH dehydrogenase FAD-containing subunit [Lysinibacillus mangiferihumi]